jgi:hypothetical protein
MRLTIALFVGILFTAAANKAADYHIGIQAAPTIALNPIANNALQDFSALLDSACHCLNTNNGPEIRIEILAPDSSLATQDFAKGRNYPYAKYPAHGFRWTLSNGLLTHSGTHTELTLTAPSHQGIANGLYALLQEKLGFKFIHARQTLIPNLQTWPFAKATENLKTQTGNWQLASGNWSGRPRFDKKGFHLHTMHPLELTQPLHDPKFPGGKEMIKEYILWLARNGQNYFEFSLMEGVDDDLEGWAVHAAEFTQYAHDRGILCGLDLSIHMIQQKAFKLVEFPPKNLHTAEKQIQHRLRTLMQAHWDFINLEFALAEFVGGLEGLRNKLRDAVLKEMAHYPNTKLIGRQHVVKPEDEMGGSHGTESLNVPNDPRMGVLVHTVMCYALTDTHVPVYELQNFNHLHQMLKDQNKVRETWFYPESAYWVTFDNSIPMLMLPYLRARWQDIQTCEALGIPGHVTFSSGWEWGYWLVDWSIARWSWDYSDDAVAAQTSPLQYLNEIFPDSAHQSLCKQIADIEQEEFLNRDLMRYLCPTNPTDELPKKLSKQFQPRMDFRWGELGKGKLVRHPETLQFVPEAKLDSVGQALQSLVGKLQQGTVPKALFPLQAEIRDAIQVVAMRCRHQAALYWAVRNALRDHQAVKCTYHAALRNSLEKPAAIREAAQTIVLRQQKRYRYPVFLLAGEYKSYTAYDFGYLYPVRALHFWEREEGQILHGKTGPFYKNIYDLAKIAGLRD